MSKSEDLCSQQDKENGTLTIVKYLGMQIIIEKYTTVIIEKYTINSLFFSLSLIDNQLWLFCSSKRIKIKITTL